MSTWDTLVSLPDILDSGSMVTIKEDESGFSAPRDGDWSSWLTSGELDGISEVQSDCTADNGGMTYGEIDRMEASGLTPKEAAERTDKAIYRCVRELSRLEALLRQKPPAWTILRRLAATVGVAPGRGMVRNARAKLRAQRARLAALAARCHVTARQLADEDYAGNRVSYLANPLDLLPHSGLEAEDPSPEWGAEWYAEPQARFRVTNAWNERNRHYGHFADIRSGRKAIITRWAKRDARNARYLLSPEPSVTVRGDTRSSWTMGPDFKVWRMSRLDMSVWRRRWRLICSAWETGRAPDWRESSILTFRQVAEIKREARAYLSSPVTQFKATVRYRRARAHDAQDTLDLTSVDSWGK